MQSDVKVLVVEDDPDARQLMASLLSQMGYGVTSAASGDEALGYIYSEELCDVVVADVVMPGMSGIELVRRSREARPGLPFVLVTGQTQGLETAVAAGAIPLPKPIAREPLSKILDELLGRQK